MKKTVFVAALAAAALGFSGLVMAEGDNRTTPVPDQQLQRAPGAGHGNARQQQRGGPGYDGRNGDQQRMQGQSPVPFPGAHGPLRRALKADPTRREGNNGYDGRNGYQGRGGYDGRGAGPSHNFYRGGRLPQEYRNRQYVVEDWRGHHLNAPPRGYQWVQTGGDYVLVAIATGIIAQILLSQ